RRFTVYCLRFANHYCGLPVSSQEDLNVVWMIIHSIAVMFAEPLLRTLLETVTHDCIESQEPPDCRGSSGGSSRSSRNRLCGRAIAECFGMKANFGTAAKFYAL